MNALSCLTSEDYYEKVFVDFENMDMGYVSCQFFKNGEWHYVIVDTYLPYSKESKKFLFTHSGGSDIFWIALLEKAYAKLHSTYYNIKNLGFEDIMIDLCNCSVTSINMEDESKKNFFESQKLFNYLLNYIKGREPYFVACLKQEENRSSS